MQRVQNATCGELHNRLIEPQRRCMTRAAAVVTVAAGAADVVVVSHCVQVSDKNI